MKRPFIIILLFVVFTVQTSYSYPGYRLIYKEQLYKLYHEHLYQYPHDYAENVMWLEGVLRADFTNPLNALASIKTKEDYTWYKNHFLLHVNLLLTKHYLSWASKYMKFDAFFYNKPYRDMSIRSMKKAKKLIEFSKVYWAKTLEYSDTIVQMKKDQRNLFFFTLPKIQHWEGEAYRIYKHRLDYEKIINRELTRIETVSEKLKTF